ncbi:MAG: TlyA family RNA methyltransferase [Cyanobacteria bacterium]|nr:TlyA family RNA methyltransferase [Cyanobacteria bacterium CG_2015-16_32_12]NCO79288.1 TlyA family RNA methyltransferase [Cyanobacteria bacterium CG_2015-22_32_23]NCQ05395.1 TlyA family RNA methyltransferase [Cyanobacteria bacterium CG_2015-09_32_10]NCQ41652.1 TlyA family RNA methyltransferase [Cyanobacteria bacterium CG_2015-04_32_10]NCS85601.1 TlyA family RNA methyltransferase [Cyanobacteria bacterium CG_2015-02_32_10]
MAKERLDVLLTQKQLCDTRAMAQKLIRAGKVRVKQHIIDKPGTLIDIESFIEVEAKPPFVSRGGEKLVKALEEFNINIQGRICLDGGISTGGFTDCLFQKGAKKVYGVDVGYGQVAWNIRQDERLVLFERTNFRNLTVEKLYQNEEKADLAVMDLSFISLTKVLGKLWDFLASPKDIILLVKPQFEVGKDKVGKNGVVRDSRLQAEAIYQVLTEGIKLGWQYQSLTWSPITGPAGNIEFLLWLNEDKGNNPPTLEMIEELTSNSQKQLKISN